MRIRWHVPLPGPFTVTGGRTRRRGPGCLPWLAVALMLGLADEYPWLLIVAAVLAVAAVLLARLR
jgi:hypothetical protein